MTLPVAASSAANARERPEVGEPLGVARLRRLEEGPALRVEARLKFGGDGEVGGEKFGRVHELVRLRDRQDQRQRGAVQGSDQRVMIRLAPIIAAMLAQGTATLDAQPLTCLTWQHMRLCQGPGGYTSTESQWQGMTLGQDSDGNRWTTSRWQDRDITTITPPGR